MKNAFYLFLLLVISANLSAQNEFLNKSNSITPLNGGVNMNPTNNTSVYTPNVFNTSKTPSNSKSSTIPEKEVDMTTNEFASPGNDIYRGKLNNKLSQSEGGGVSMKQFRRNISLGEIRTKSEYIRVLYRDGGQIDGDRVKLLVNDKVAYAEMYLGYEYKELRIDLVKGFNKVDFEALTEGLLPPNTAVFTILDDKGEIMISNNWDLSVGFKATYMVVKE